MYYYCCYLLLLLLLSAAMFRRFSAVSNCKNFLIDTFHFQRDSGLVCWSLTAGVIRPGGLWVCNMPEK